MQTFYIEKIQEVKKLKTQLEKKLNIKISINKKNLTFQSPNSVDEYEASLVFEAIAFGFHPKKALALKDEEMLFKKIHIKAYTNRNLKDVLARLIGRKGKTKKTFCEITGCEILIKDGEVGILGYVESVNDAETAVINVIKGSKQTNMYRYLERMNRERKQH